MDFKGLTKFISCQIRAKDDSAFTPADIWVVKYKYGYNYLFPICNPIVAFSSECVPPIGRHHDAYSHSPEG